MTAFGPHLAHPVANVFPMLDEAQLRELADDIRDNGQAAPCILWNDQLLDGRNRWRACELAGVEPQTIDRSELDEGAAVRLAVSANLHRRHLSESQRAMIAARLLATGKFAHDGRARDAAAEATSVSSRSVGAATRVVQQGAPELQHAVERGEVAVSAAAEVAKLPIAEQAEVVAAGPSAVSSRAREIRENSRRALTSSESNEHYTPSDIVEAMRRVLGGIDLDPASSPTANEVVKAERFYDEATDGLAQQWAGRVWLNPPYGKSGNESNQALWLRKLRVEHVEGRVPAAGYICNAQTGDQWFDVVWESAAICFLRGRVRFLDPETLEPQGSPTHGSVVGYLGDDVEAFAREFSTFGWVVPMAMLAEWRATLFGGAA